MRIVGGIHRGRVLKAPKGLALRPTADKPRQSLFDILMHGKPGGAPFDIEGRRALDAFCGTGAFGLEALSRGAAHAVLMDADGKALKAARENAVALGEETRVTVIRADATRPPDADQACDIVFLDPPYESGLGQKALAALGAKGWIGGNALAVLEVAAREDETPADGFEIVDVRGAGPAKFLFLRCA